MRVVDRRGQGDVVVDLVPDSEAGRDLLSRADRGAAAAVLALRLRCREPLVRPVGDEDGVVRELHLVARPVGHDFGRGDHPARLAVRSEDLVATRRAAHRRSSRTGVGTGVAMPRALPSSRAEHVVGQRDDLVGRAEDELARVQDERLVAVRLDQPGQLGLLDRRVDVRVAVVLEDPEVAVDPHVDAGRLHHLPASNGSSMTRPAAMAARMSLSESSTGRP